MATGTVADGIQVHYNTQVFIRNYITYYFTTIATYVQKEY